jgi:hypothetical protein
MARKKCDYYLVLKNISSLAMSGAAGYRAHVTMLFSAPDFSLNYGSVFIGSLRHKPRRPQ